MRNLKIKGMAAMAAILCMTVSPTVAERLVILHTNDTHSSIEPSTDGSGGILNRKAIMDSVRRAEKNVIAVDAGDAVQGSLYFKFFRGDVEYPLMDMMGYDIRILGNHEFDNGLRDLARHYKKVKGTPLSANYDFTGTELEGVFKPWVIKKVGGKKIGFIGLNVNPESLIVAGNYKGMKFSDIIETANREAGILKREKGCDLVVAVTHIGYTSTPDRTSDVDLARASRDIDIIIGGHSHTLVDPEHPEINPCFVDNADGRPVLITQTGKYGKKIGKIEIDLDAPASADPKQRFGYSLIPVTARFPEQSLDRKMSAFIAPYRHVVDSVNAHVIGKALRPLDSDERNGGYPNFAADFAMWYGYLKADSIVSAGGTMPRPDMAVMNVGGIRQNMPEGDITEGQMLSTFPFSNSMMLISLKGKDIIESLGVAARKGGEAISGNVRVVTDSVGNLVRVVIDDEDMDPEQVYTVATIDYVAQGNDDLRSMARNTLLWRDDVEMAAPMLRYIRHLTDLGLPVAPDPTGRFQKQVSLDSSQKCSHCRK